MEDREIAAMQAVVIALGQLDESERMRVLTWAAQRYGCALPTSVAESPKPQTDEAVRASGLDEFADFATLFSRFEPRDGPEKALVAAYWLQVCQRQDTFEGAAVNSELKHLGHGLPNVTDSLTSLIGRRPSLALQVRKSGTSQQARKKYKLTHQGIEVARSRLSGGGP